MDYWGDIKEKKENLGSVGRKSPSKVQGRSPGKESGGHPQKLRLFFCEIKIQQILGDNTIDIPLHKYWGDMLPCPIGIDAPAMMYGLRLPFQP